MKMPEIGRSIREWRDEALRSMYSGAKGNSTARRFARLWGWVFSRGLGPGSRWVTLEVPGRKSGKATRFPLGMAMVDGQAYLGSMLGNTCNWVRNVRANDGYAVIDHRGRRRVHLTEIPGESSAPLLKAYVQQVPGARPHIPVQHTQPANDFESCAQDYPIFRVEFLPDLP
ncbi:nitroreductase/quinone reductase family protein [Mycobacterium sp. CVI_P3]|uniref:Nitroreductase/quinone reductase family protein n=1 Tax=Mycobacterium pinniadriaticum TaxID=2994102 RepID=A0ABT3S8R6_9MYCO|nr:nitroreductase/quinone reductase family protein [Mycobacterium pinniadriaticum]MCX2929475.1 nitroreductase/quinone reductase family protein [Mycobacterium pinniadriaticum]MCX2935899.1 nitroreductase/quinone reductase family protein [Mycobacterium pinniadriaticum]